MDTGTGIAIAGIWVFVAVAWSAERVSAIGAWLALIVGCLFTWGFK